MENATTSLPKMDNGLQSFSVMVCADLKDAYLHELRLCNVSAGIGGKSYLAYNKVPQAVVEFCK